MSNDEIVSDDPEQDLVALWQVAQPALRLSDNIASKTWRSCELYREYFVGGLVQHPPYPSWWLWADYLAFAVARSLGLVAGESAVLVGGGPHAG